jgi:hypothetical protein
MAIDAFALARRFEPILYFHPQERFCPCDAKRYLELCALWKAVAPYDTKASWGRPKPGEAGARVPNILEGKIAGFPNEAPPQEDMFLGEKQQDKFPFLEAESFLEVGGWEDSRGVTAVSKNRYAALGFIEQLCNNDDPNVGKLKNDRYWYYAEVYETERLRGLFPQERPVPSVPRTIELLDEPILLCYYLFFPGHDEGLQGCENTATGPQFGSFAGEWACLAILLEKPAGQPNHGPTWIGLTNRNVGVINFLGQESRIGMNVVEWTGVLKAPAPGDEHPLIYVGKGTHGLHRKPGKQELAPFSPQDPSSGSCGDIETVEQQLAEAQPTSDEEPDVYTVKSVGGALAWLVGTLGTGGIAGALLGAAYGWIWALNEAIEPRTTAPSAGKPQYDYPPEEGVYGDVIHPAGVEPPNAPADPDKRHVWTVKLDKTLGDRNYPFIVDRVSTDPNVRQIWWPSDDRKSGFLGRWGPRVTKDPKGRRAGMVFPDFWKMFFEALAKARSRP